MLQFDNYNFKKSVKRQAICYTLMSLGNAPRPSAYHLLHQLNNEKICKKKATITFPGYERIPEQKKNHLFIGDIDFLQ